MDYIFVTTLCDNSFEIDLPYLQFYAPDILKIFILMLFNFSNSNILI